MSIVILPDNLNLSRQSWESTTDQNRCSFTANVEEDLIEVVPSPKLKRHNSLKLIRQKDVAVITFIVIYSVNKFQLWPNLNTMDEHLITIKIYKQSWLNAWLFQFKQLWGNNSTKHFGFPLLKLTQGTGSSGQRRHSLRLPKSKSCGRMNDPVVDDDEVKRTKVKSSTIEHISRAMRSLRTATMLSSSSNNEGGANAEGEKHKKSKLQKNQ